MESISKARLKRGQIRAGLTPILLPVKLFSASSVLASDTPLGDRFITPQRPRLDDSDNRGMYLSSNFSYSKN